MVIFILIGDCVVIGFGRMKIYKGKCFCGRKLEFRSTDIRQDEKNIMTVQGYIVIALSEKCKEMFVLGCFMDTKLPPEIGVDFDVDWNSKFTKKDRYNKRSYEK